MSRRPLGQHFLINRNVVNRIIQALDLSPDSHVLEIGPGKGALTGPLVHRVEKLLLVEKDPVLAEEVRNRLAGKGNVHVREGDFLTTPWEEISQELGAGFKIVSNLPYQAATAILTKLLSLASPSTTMVLMFQKEVADRLKANPRTKDYGSLTVFTQILSQVKPLLDVEPLAFRPPPKVWSSVLKFQLREEPLLPKSEHAMFELLLKTGFGHRRKMLRQNLRAYFSGETADQIEQRLSQVDASPLARAEELTVQQWVNLYSGNQ